LSCVYLTFDDGPDPRSTEWLLDLLSKEKVPSTFFCLGSQIVRYPELYDDIIKKGHAVGTILINMKKEIKQAQKIIFPLFKKRTHLCTQIYSGLPTGG